MLLWLNVIYWIGSVIGSFNGVNGIICVVCNWYFYKIGLYDIVIGYLFWVNVVIFELCVNEIKLL